MASVRRAAPQEHGARAQSEEEEEEEELKMDGMSVVEGSHEVGGTNYN